MYSGGWMNRDVEWEVGRKGPMKTRREKDNQHSGDTKAGIHDLISQFIMEEKKWKAYSKGKKYKSKEDKQDGGKRWSQK